LNSNETDRPPLPEIPTMCDAAVDWMRRRGVVEFSHDGLSLKLGPEPVVKQPPAAPLTEDQMVALLKRKKEQQDALLFASSEGFPEHLDDE
jgi:hypothetical protein